MRPALWAIALIAALGAPETEPARPNVVLVMTDDQGWGDVTCRGGLATPALDAMAKAGVTFTRFHAASPVCSPTRASVLTGRHPFRMGITHANVGHLPAEELTLAELLASAGYATGHFGKWHLGTLTKDIEESNRGGPRGKEHYAPPWEHGFDVCFSTEAKVPTFDPLIVPGPEHGGTGGRPAGEAFGTNFWTGPGERVTENMAGDTSTLVMDRALAFIEGAVKGSRPFLAVIWFHAPHLPVVADEEHLALFPDLPLKERHYKGTLTATDENLGRLRARLDTLGIAERTLLWFSSDNGPEGGSKSGLGSTAGLRGRKRDLYEGGTRVPGFFEWPGGPFEAGSTVSAPASSLDILPTLAAILGLELELAARELDGIDLTPLLAGKRKTRNRPMGFLHADREAWTGDRWKLHRRGDQPYEIYDLLSDPIEAIDLAANEPERVQALAAELAQWRRAVERDGTD